MLSAVWIEIIFIYIVPETNKNGCLRFRTERRGVYFAVSDAAREIGAWDSRLQVTSRGYMLGYNDLRDPSVSGFFRFLARVGDNGMKMQIVKIRF